MSPALGAFIGRVPEGETLAGWAKVATGDGRYVVTRSGVCFGRSHDPSIPADLAWAAVDTFLAQSGSLSRHTLAWFAGQMR